MQLAKFGMDPVRVLARVFGQTDCGLVGRNRIVVSAQARQRMAKIQPRADAAGVLFQECLGQSDRRCKQASIRSADDGLNLSLDLFLGHFRKCRWATFRSR